MNVFQYTALAPGGKPRLKGRQKGIIEASSAKEAKERLRQRGVLVTQLRPARSARQKGRLNRQQLIDLTTQLSQLVRSGLPIFESLMALEEQVRGTPYHPVVLHLCDAIKEGMTLSAAISLHPSSFPPIYAAMCRAGESSGSLDRVLEKLAKLLAKQAALRKQVVTALIYPAVILTFCLGVIGLLMTFAIPSVEALFQGKSLGLMTRLVIGASHLLRSYWYLYPPFVAGGITAGLLFLRSSRGKALWSLWSLKLPLIRKMVVQGTLARFARTLATLQEGGVPLIDSLRLAAKVIGNPHLEGDIISAEQAIISGSSLSQELRKSRYIPPLVPRMLAVAEETGNLSPMLHHIADLYEGEMEKTLSRLTTLLQPALLVLMGGLVGIIMLAVLLPLADVSALL